MPVQLNGRMANHTGHLSWYVYVFTFPYRIYPSIHMAKNAKQSQEINVDRNEPFKIGLVILAGGAH